MTRFFLAGAAVLGLMSGVALAQSTTSATSQTGVPGDRVITPPSAPGTVTTSSTNGHMMYSDGDRSLSAGAGSSNDQGTSSDTIVTTKTYPFSNLITTTTKTTNVNNGVASEKTATTQTYPAMAGFAGSSSTTEKTKTAPVAAK